MPVRPIASNPDGSILAFCDETSHAGTIPVAAIGFAMRADGTPEPTVIVLACPDGCGHVATAHPVAGGAAPAAVQELFARTIARLGCPCSTPIAAGKPLLIAQAHAKLHAERMDGIGRWAIVGTLK